MPKSGVISEPCVSPMPARRSGASWGLRDGGTRAGKRDPRPLTQARAFSLCLAANRGLELACGDACPRSLSAVCGGESLADDTRDRERSDTWLQVTVPR